MPTRGRRRGSSHSVGVRGRQGSIRRPSTSRGASRQSLRRSARIMGLPPSTGSASSGVQDADGIPNITRPQQDGTPASFGENSNALLEIHYTAPTRFEHSTVDSYIGTLAPLIGNDGQPPYDLYNMTMLVQPPCQIHSGSLFYPPPIVRVNLISEPSLLFVFLTIWAEDGTTSLPPNLLVGSTAQSINQPESAIDDGGFGFASFPDIAIREPGRYRIRAQLFRMNVVTSLGENTSDERGYPMGYIASHVVQVIPDVIGSLPV